MKKRLLLVLCFIFSFIFINKVDAYNIICDDADNLYYLDYFTCHVTSYELGNYDKLSGTINKNDYVSCAVSSVDSGLTNTSKEVTRFDLTGQSKSSNLVDYKCQVIGKASSDITTNVEISDFTYHIFDSEVDAQKEILRSDSDIKIHIFSNVTTTTSDGKNRDTSNGNSLLKSLTDSNLKLTFSKFKTEYNVQVLYDVDKLELNAIPVNADATVRIVGNTDLIVGSNVIDIYVTSPDNKATTCYTLYVERLPRGEEVYYVEKDASLASLTITGFPLKFESIIYDYSIHLTNDVSHVELAAVATNPNSVVSIDNTSNLENGSIITITVTSEDGTNVEKYKVNVTKDAPDFDFKPFIIIGCTAVFIVCLIVIIIKTNKRREEKDPVLRLKHNKGINNKGAKFNANAVQETGIKKAEIGNVIVEDDVNKNIIQVVPDQEDPNLNKITSHVVSVDLSTSVQPIPVESINQNTDNNNSKVEQESVVQQSQTDDKINQVVKQPVETNMFDQSPQQPVETNMFDQVPQQAVETNMFDQVPQQAVETNMFDQVPQQAVETNMFDQVPQQAVETNMFDQVPQQVVQQPVQNGDSANSNVPVLDLSNANVVTPITVTNQQVNTVISDDDDDIEILE